MKIWQDLNICCRRQHSILNMKFCVYVCSVSLAELCIAERQLDFICMYVRMFGWSDLWRILTSPKFLKITYSRSRFDFPNTVVAPHEQHHEPWQIKNNILQIATWLSAYRGCISRIHHHGPWPVVRKPDSAIHRIVIFSSFVKSVVDWYSSY
jgi:hypothetical protein